MASFPTHKGLELINHHQFSTAAVPIHLPLSRPTSFSCGLGGSWNNFPCGSSRFSNTRRQRSIGCHIWRRDTRRVWCPDAAAAASRQQEQEVSVLDQSKALSLVDEFRKSLATPVETLAAIVDEMVEAFAAGLAAETGTLLKMLPAYIERLPSGEEKGCYYALDLGGTNFRVLRAELGGKEGRLLKQEFKVYSIPPELMIGESDDLFNFIAEKLGDFIAVEEEIHKDSDRKRELGFTFSFPVQQHSIASGTLIHWSKGFKVRGTPGKDVVTVLQDAIKRKGLDLEVAALVNDTVGTLAGGRYWNEDVMVGVIVGTGTNACYVEDAEAVPKWKGAPPASGTHVINTEWGDFNSTSLPKIFADEDLDRESVNPGEHIFEKLMSGMYLGEIVRRLTLKLAQEGALFGDYATGGLSEKQTLTTPDVSKMHADESSSLDVAGEIFSKAWGIHSTSVEERKIVLSIVDMVTQRAARLGAAGIVAVLKKIGRVGGTAGSDGNGKPLTTVRPTDGNGKPVTTIVAMDGGMYERYVKFREYMLAAFEELLGKEGASTVAIQLSKDGSGIGAALLAASHSRYNEDSGEYRGIFHSLGF